MELCPSTSLIVHRGFRVKPCIFSFIKIEVKHTWLPLSLSSSFYGSLFAVIFFFLNMELNSFRKTSSLFIILTEQNCPKLCFQNNSEIQDPFKMPTITFRVSILYLISSQNKGGQEVEEGGIPAMKAKEVLQAWLGIFSLWQSCFCLLYIVKG